MGQLDINLSNQLWSFKGNTKIDWFVNAHLVLMSEMGHGSIVVAAEVCYLLSRRDFHYTSGRI